MWGEAVDYLVITPGDDTPLNGETLLVDDTYSGIHYSGSGWSSVDSNFSLVQRQNSPSIHAQALQNGTHQTSNIGDSFTFYYTGKLFFLSSLICFILIYLGRGMTVYGILPKPDGSLSLSYTIDGGNAITVSPKIVDDTRDELNYVMLQTGPLAAGNHTIVVTLTDIVTNQKFIVDYITYVPSFPNLAAMPKLSNLSSESWSNSTSQSQSSPNASDSSLSNNSSGSTSSSRNASSPTSPSNPSPPRTSHSSSSNNSSASAPRPSSSGHVGAIAGSVVGSVACLAIIIIAVLLCIRRRRPSATENNRIEPFLCQTSVSCIRTFTD
jgi:hypothetical protein